MLVAYADSSSERAMDVRNALMREYKISNLGLSPRDYSTPRWFDFTQSADYIDSIFRRFHMEDANSAPTPLHRTRLDIDMSTDREADSTMYQAIVGSLMYAATSTRPDIVCAVAVLSQYNTKPYTTHMTAAKRVIRYLKGTKGVGSVYPGI